MFLSGIDGDSPTNLYTDGEYFDSLNNAHPLMYHLSGSQWSRFNIQDIPDCGLYKMSFYASNRALVLGFKHLPDGSAPDSDEIFSFDAGNLKQIYSGVDNSRGWTDLTTISGGVILEEGDRLFMANAGELDSLVTIQNPEFGGQIAARSTQDIFIRMLDGIAQYNGTDVQYIFTRPNLNISAMIAFPSSIFAIGYSYTTHLNYVYRGYLPE